MRKYVVPIAALAGIALLIPTANAANLIIKSRVGCTGRPVSLPVAVSAPTSGTELWGVDFALTFDTTKVTAATDASGNSFTPQAVTGSTETPVVVTGAPTVGTVVTNPNLYVGYVRGTSGMPLSTKGTAAPDAGIGLLRLNIASGVTTATAVPLSVPANYNVANDGTGSTTVSRPGASGATSTATAGAAVNAETVTLYTGFLGGTAPAGSAPDLRVPLNEVAISPSTVGPGNLNGNTTLDSGDLTQLANALVGKPSATWSDYKRIAGDVAPSNGYTPTTVGGTAGQGYGDGVLTSGDLTTLSNKLVGKPTSANFPVCE